LFLQNMAKPPATLPPTSIAPLKVTLLLGSGSYHPEKLELFNLYIPASHPAPVHPDEADFHVLPELKHTFNAPPNLPPRAVSALFAGLVLVVPWAALLGLVSVHARLLLLSSYAFPIFSVVYRRSASTSPLLAEYPSFHGQSWSV
jgi:hypothetical protein